MTSRSRAAILAAMIAAFPLPVLAEAASPTLSLSAEGTVRAVPDTAIVTAGVLSEADTAGEALTRNNEAMRGLMDELTAAGIAERDVGTSNFSIDPVMVYPQPRSDGTQDPPRITGYRVSNQVTVKIRDVSKAGDILDRVVRIGANQIQGIAFVVDDDKALMDDARADAMKAAARKAAVYAEAGGFTLGRIVSVSETSGQMPMPVPYARMAMAEAKAPDSVPFAPGEREMSVTVTVSWEIHQAR